MDSLEFLWPYEVKSAFRATFSRREREAEFTRLSEKFPSRIPVIVETLTASSPVALPKQSFMPPETLSADQFQLAVSRRLGTHEGTFQMFLGGRILRSVKSLMSLYDDNRGEDGFLYLHCSFGQEVLIGTQKDLLTDSAYADWVHDVVSSTTLKKQFASRVLDLLSGYVPVVLTDTNSQGKTYLLTVPLDISKFSFVAQTVAILGLDIDLFVGEEHKVKGRTHVVKLYTIWKDESDGILYVKYRDKAACRVM